MRRSFGGGRGEFTKLASLNWLWRKLRSIELVRYKSLLQLQGGGAHKNMCLEFYGKTYQVGQFAYVSIYREDRFSQVLVVYLYRMKSRKYQKL